MYNVEKNTLQLNAMSPVKASLVNWLISDKSATLPDKEADLFFSWQRRGKTSRTKLQSFQATRLCA